MQKIIRRIRAGADRIVEIGLQPAYVVLSLENYQSFLVESAAEEKTDHLEARESYGSMAIVAIPGEDILEVVPQVLEMWEEAEHFAPSQPPLTPTDFGVKEVVTFAEL